jgi:hypothetical protein
MILPQVHNTIGEIYFLGGFLLQNISNELPNNANPLKLYSICHQNFQYSYSLIHLPKIKAPAQQSYRRL